MGRPLARDEGGNITAYIGNARANPSTTESEQEKGVNSLYRRVYPNEVEQPGATWTTLQNGPEEVHDRVDIVYYAGDGVDGVEAYAIGLREETPTDRAVPSYPSDHRAVVGVFALGE